MFLMELWNLSPTPYHNSPPVEFPKLYASPSLGVLRLESAMWMIEITTKACSARVGKRALPHKLYQLLPLFALQTCDAIKHDY